MQLQQRASVTTWCDVFPFSLPQNPSRFSDDQRGQIDLALGIAQFALTNKDCAALLKGVSKDPLQTLKDLAGSTGNKGQGFVNMSHVRPRSGNFETIAKAVRVLGFGFGSGPAVALYGGFFDDRSQFGLTANQTRALDILHELGHITRAYFHSSIPNMFGMGENKSQEAVDRAIRDACFKNALPRGVT